MKSMSNVRNYFYRYVTLLFVVVIFGEQLLHAQQVICNPLNLEYRYMPEQPSRREAADPTMVVHKGEYYLFASKTGGYWWSKDLISWKLIETNQIPTEDYAPAAIVIGDTFYFIASSATKNPILRSTDPKSGKWEVVRDSLPFAVWDPAFFMDDDQKLYLYWGCSNSKPIYGIELDFNKNFEPIGSPKELIHAQTQKFGWENPGDYNELQKQAPWIEGPWVIKHNGLYYLQYAGPGTEFKSYSDAMYVGTSPLGDFKPAEHNPIAYKPEGFINGVGHGAIFQDIYGNYWHIGTMSISVKHMFERRLALNPIFFDESGTMYCWTGFGDYPMMVPSGKFNKPADLSLNWMLLSYKKPVEVSSQMPDYPAHNSVNEDVRTWWSAATGEKGEWLKIDLQKKANVNAVQINFADHETNILSRLESNYYSYTLEYSVDGNSWQMLEDKSVKGYDLPHDFIVISKPVEARFLKLTNYHVPGGKFAISGFRVFGSVQGEKPKTPAQFNVNRDRDKRVVQLNWQSDKNINGFNIVYGSAPDKLYHNYMVYDSTRLTIRSLNATMPYYFKIAAFNERGLSDYSSIVEVK